MDDTDIEARRLIAEIRDATGTAKGMIDRLEHGKEAVRLASAGRKRTPLEVQALKLRFWAALVATGLETIRKEAADQLEPEVGAYQPGW